MSAFEQIALAIQAMKRALALLFRPGFWMPWLVLAAVQGVVILLLCWFAHPLISWFTAPLVRMFAGARALHYPEIFASLPSIYARVDLVVVAVVGTVMAGAATLMVARDARGSAPEARASLAHAGTRGIALVLVNLPYHLLIFALSYGLTAMMAGKHPLLQGIASLAVLLGSVLIQSLFLYVSAVLLIEGRGVTDTLRALPRMWSAGVWAALTISGLLLLPLLPLYFLGSQTSAMVQRGTPELAAWMTAAQGLVAIAVAFVLTASATLVYLGAVALPAKRS